MSVWSDSNYRSLFKAAVAQGFTVSTTRGGHIKIMSPQGGLYFAAATPSDRRAFANLRSGLRRIGFHDERPR